MFCSKCGADNELGSKFCGSCGKPISSENKETIIEPVKSERNPDGSFNLPWGGGTFWLNNMTGVAEQVKVDKRSVVYTTTSHQTHSTSNYDYMSGRLISGSVTVPVTKVHTKLEVESEFWLTDNNGNQEHFSFDHEILPIKNGQRISVIWGALTGKEKGQYKCIYNHNTGDYKILPNSYGEFGLVRPYSVLFIVIKVFLTLALAAGVMLALIELVTNSLLGAFLSFTPAIALFLFSTRIKASLIKKNKDLNKKAAMMTNLIVKYARSLCEQRK